MADDVSDLLQVDVGQGLRCVDDVNECSFVDFFPEGVEFSVLGVRLSWLVAVSSRNLVSFRSWETFFQFSAWEFAAASMRFCRSDFSLSSFFVAL